MARLMTWWKGKLSRRSPPMVVRDHSSTVPDDRLEEKVSLLERDLVETLLAFGRRSADVRMALAKAAIDGRE
jgi:hypothetical protein